MKLKFSSPKILSQVPSVAMDDDTFSLESPLRTNVTPTTSTTSTANTSDIDPVMPPINTNDTQSLPITDSENAPNQRKSRKRFINDILAEADSDYLDVQPSTKRSRSEKTTSSDIPEYEDLSETEMVNDETNDENAMETDQTASSDQFQTTSIQKNSDKPTLAKKGSNETRVIEAIKKQTKNISFKGINVNTCTKQGNTPLHLVITKYDRPEKKIRTIVEMGANINAQNEKGQTPLHWAAKHEKVKEINLLLELGASKDIKDNKGRRPIDFDTSQDVQDALQ